MKYVGVILGFIFCASPLFAQAPSISYMMADEAKSQLQIHGSFGNTPGTVTIEDTTLGIASWSDSLIICSLPDSGQGAGGGVVVQTAMGKSNKRMLSIFSMVIDRTESDYEGVNGYVHSLDVRWKINWRADINYRGITSQFSFEISKTSYGLITYVYSSKRDAQYPSLDSANKSDSSITLKGIMDLKFHIIHFSLISLYSPDFNGHIVDYQIQGIPFDTTGVITGYKEYYDNGYSKGYDSVYNAKILFPPNLKSTVYQQFQIRDPIKIWTEDCSVKIKSETPLGTSTASLYSIDGRLLKRTKLDVSSPGVFTIDASDPHIHFVILVLQTEKGLITKKILF